MYLIISSEFCPGPGGIGKHAYSVAKSLVAKGNAVDVICDIDYASKEDIFQFINSQPQGLNIIHIPRNGFYTYFDRIQKSIKAVRKANYKKVIVTGKFSLWIGGVLKLIFRKGLNVECFIHGSEIRSPFRVQQWWLHKCLQRMNKIWVVSQFTKSLLPDDIKKLNTTQVLPNGLNINDWPDEVLHNNPLQWVGNPRLLTVGNISKRKGQHSVVNALSEMIKHFPDIHYHIVGMATNAEQIRELAKRHGVLNNITIHGILSNNDLIRAYQSADIFCMLSENQSNGDVEGFGIAILEANIMGLPAIGSKGCGIEDAIQYGFNGYLVNASNSAELTEHISLVLDAMPGKWKTNGVEWAKRHDWDLLVNNLL